MPKNVLNSSLNVLCYRNSIEVMWLFPNSILIQPFTSQRQLFTELTELEQLILRVIFQSGVVLVSEVCFIRMYNRRLQVLNAN